MCGSFTTEGTSSALQRGIYGEQNEKEVLKMDTRLLDFLLS